MTDNNINTKYELFIEKLKIEFADFLSEVEKGKVYKSRNLIARKRSINLRKLLSEFRKLSLEFEKSFSSKDSNKNS